MFLTLYHAIPTLNDPKGFGKHYGGKKKGGIILRIMHFEWSPLKLWINLWIVNTYSEFKVNISSSSKDIEKCQSFSKSKKGRNSKKIILNCLP